MRGIEEGRAEIDVAPLSLRAGALAGSLAPTTFARLQRRLGSARLSNAIAARAAPQALRCCSARSPTTTSAAPLT